MDDLKQLKTALFLKEFKQLIQEHGLYIVNRLDNQKSLADLEITKKDCKKEIIGLSVTDYCNGPKPDTDRAGEI